MTVQFLLLGIAVWLVAAASLATVYHVLRIRFELNYRPEGAETSRI